MNKIKTKKANIIQNWLKVLISFSYDYNKRFKEKLIDLKKERINIQYYLRESERDYSEFAKEFLENCKIKFTELKNLEINKIRNEY